ncbi:hypothetical protein BH10PSE15_BH10PSE15_14610 [soil metagenome]
MSNLDEILARYQVNDDTMIDWSPSAGGFIPLGGLGGTRRMTETEGEQLDSLTFSRGFYGLSVFKDIAEEAFRVSAQRVPPPLAKDAPGHVIAAITLLPLGDQAGALKAWPTNDGHTDAFRHCCWNAMLAVEFGVNWTQSFTNAHEGIPGNFAVREAMDLYNNEVGRKIAAANSSATRPQLADKVLEALNRGELVVVDKDGRLAWSNTVARGDHGVAPVSVLPGAIAAAVARPTS